MVANGVALDQPATRRGVARRFGFAAGLVAATLALAAGAVSIAGADRAANAVQRDGVRTPATVTAITTQPSGRGQFPVGTATVTFAVDGRPRTADIYLSTRISDVHQGDPVAVVYDPADPSHAELQGVRSSGRGVPFVPVAFVGALVAIMAVVATRHALAVRRILADHPWRTVPARVERVPVAGGRRPGSKVVVELDRPAGPAVVETIGLNRIDPGIEPEAWVAGAPDGRLVLALPGGGHLTYVRPVRS